MSASPGRLQSVFNAGEIDPLMWERTELKYYVAGLRRAENIEVTPQGGFRLRDGLRDVGALAADASRLFAFNASDGSSYDLVFRGGQFEAWSATAKLATVTLAGVTADILANLTTAQRYDTMFLFHQDLETRRLELRPGNTWQVDNLPYQNVPNWDYGADIDGDPYVNGVAAVWELQFVGLTSGTTAFALTVNGQDTPAILYNSTMATLGPLVLSAIENLGNVESGIGVTTPGADKLRISFSGTGNEGDSWAVTGRVVNKSDAAVTAAKITVGVPPGEPIFSADRGWPQCGAFYQQRLIIGGFKSAPNVWAWSATGNYFNFDDRNPEADGAALVPMDSAGGETIEAIVDNRYLLVFTNKAEYWISERALSATAPPNMVQASAKGVRRGVPIVANEGAVVYALPSGNVLDEFRYTDVEGNYVSLDLSLIASHLIAGVRDQAHRPAELSTDGNHLAVVKADGTALLGTLLRDQDPPVTAFTRLTSGAGLFKAVVRNGRNQLSYIMERSSGRRLERFEEGLLLDEAQDFAFGPASPTITGLGRFDGRIVWVIGDGDVFGPFTVSAGSLTLPRPVSAATVGSWSPPVVETLPLDRAIGPAIVKKGKARIYAASISLLDTTSIAVSTNGRTLQDQDLYRWGLPANVPELQAGFTGTIKVPGLVGWSDEPWLTISQVRPGRLTVRSITLHARV